MEKLVARLCVPAVTSALRKEELCLALSSLARLRCLRRRACPVNGSRSTSPSVRAAWPHGECTAALRLCTRRVLPLCSAQELAMVSQGAVALSWCDADFAHAVIAELYARYCMAHTAADTCAPSDSALGARATAAGTTSSCGTASAGRVRGQGTVATTTARARALLASAPHTAPPRLGELTTVAEYATHVPHLRSATLIYLLSREACHIFRVLPEGDVVVARFVRAAVRCVYAAMMRPGDGAAGAAVTCEGRTASVNANENAHAEFKCTMHDVVVAMVTTALLPGVRTSQQALVQREAQTACRAACAQEAARQRADENCAHNDHDTQSRASHTHGGCESARRCQVPHWRWRLAQACRFDVSGATEAVRLDFRTHISGHDDGAPGVPYDPVMVQLLNACRPTSSSCCAATGAQDTRARVYGADSRASRDALTFSTASQAEAAYHTLRSGSGVVDGAAVAAVRDELHLWCSRHDESHSLSAWAYVAAVWVELCEPTLPDALLLQLHRGCSALSVTVGGDYLVRVNSVLETGEGAMDGLSLSAASALIEAAWQETTGSLLPLAERVLRGVADSAQSDGVALAGETRSTRNAKSKHTGDVASEHDCVRQCGRPDAADAQPSDMAEVLSCAYQNEGLSLCAADQLPTTNGVSAAVRGLLYMRHTLAQPLPHTLRLSAGLREAHRAAAAALHGWVHRCIAAALAVPPPRRVSGDGGLTVNDKCSSPHASRSAVGRRSTHANSPDRTHPLREEDDAEDLWLVCRLRGAVGLLCVGVTCASTPVDAAGERGGAGALVAAQLRRALHTHESGTPPPHTTAAVRVCALMALELSRVHAHVGAALLESVAVVVGDCVTRRLQRRVRAARCPTDGGDGAVHTVTATSVSRSECRDDDDDDDSANDESASASRLCVRHAGDAAEARWVMRMAAGAAALAAPALDDFVATLLHAVDTDAAAHGDLAHRAASPCRVHGSLSGGAHCGAALPMDWYVGAVMLHAVAGHDGAVVRLQRCLRGSVSLAGRLLSVSEMVWCCVEKGAAVDDELAAEAVAVAAACVRATTRRWLPDAESTRASCTHDDGNVCRSGDGDGTSEAVDGCVGAARALETMMGAWDERTMVQCVGRLLVAYAQRWRGALRQSRTHRGGDASYPDAHNGDDKSNSDDGDRLESNRASAERARGELEEWLCPRVRVLEPAVYTALCAVVALRPAHTTTPDSAPAGDDPDALGEALITALPRRLRDLALEQLAGAVDGLGALPSAGQRLTHQLTTDYVADFVVDHIDQFVRGPVLATVLDGLSRLHCTRSSLYRVAGDRLMRRAVLATLHRGAMIRVLAALGRVRFLHKPLVDRLTEVLVWHAEELTAQEMLQVMRGHARVGLRGGELHRGLAGALLGCHAAGGRAKWTGLSWSERVELLRLLAATHGACTQTTTILPAVASTQTTTTETASPPTASAAPPLSQLTQRVGESVAAAVSRQSGDAAVTALAALVASGAAPLPSSAAGDVMRYLSDPAVLATVHLDSIVTLGDLLGECSEMSRTMAELLHSLAQVAVSRGEGMSPEGCRVLLDALARHNVHHPPARLALSARARQVSKEIVMLSTAEAEEMQRMIAV